MEGGNPDNLTPWKPGQSGNPSGRPKTKPLTDEFKRRRDENEGELAKELIQVAIDAAKKGDFRFWQELMNRSDGKVIEQIDLTADVNVQDLPGLTEKDLAKLGEDHDGPE